MRVRLLAIENFRGTARMSIRLPVEAPERS